MLVTTLTKKMSEDLTDYLKEIGIKVRYLHSDIKTLERMQILRDLRLGDFHVLVGINLLREGLGLAGGFACRDSGCGQRRLFAFGTFADSNDRPCGAEFRGRVIMYADKITDSMEKAIDETERRRRFRSPIMRSMASRRRRSARKCAM